jgi:hypothetical protein
MILFVAVLFFRCIQNKKLQFAFSFSSFFVEIKSSLAPFLRFFFPRFPIQMHFFRKSSRVIFAFEIRIKEDLGEAYGEHG